METETVLGKLDLGSVTSFLKKKDTPGQEDHPEKEGYNIRVSLNGVWVHQG